MNAVVTVKKRKITLDTAKSAPEVDSHGIPVDAAYKATVGYYLTKYKRQIVALEGALWKLRTNFENCVEAARAHEIERSNKLFGKSAKELRQLAHERTMLQAKLERANREINRLASFADPIIKEAREETVRNAEAARAARKAERELAQELVRSARSSNRPVGDRAKDDEIRKLAALVRIYTEHMEKHGLALPVI